MRNADKIPINIDYAFIRGSVKPVTNEIDSSFNKAKGVIKVFKVIEHVVKTSSNYIRDAQNLLSKSIFSEPFYLISGKTKIEINQPLSAGYLMDELEQTHYNFDPLKHSIADRIFDKILKDEISKGIETTEYMLKTGTVLNAYGNLVKDNGYLKLLPPIKSGCKYIITKKNRQELIDDLKFGKSMMKFFGFIMVSISVGYVAYKLKKPILFFFYKIKRSQEAKRMKKEREKLAKELNREINDPNQDQQNCIICLTNPREVILLDCGHICLCLNCLELLPSQKCPICQKPFRSTARCFIP